MTITDLDGVLIARVLGAAVEPTRQALESLWAMLRPAWCGRPARPPRIWRT